MNDNRNKRSICYVATTGKCLALFIWPQAKFLAEHGWQVTLAASENDQESFPGIAPVHDGFFYALLLKH